MRLTSKLLLTVPVVALLGWSFVPPRGGVFGELETFGPWAAVIAVGFFAAVVLYCRDLERLMRAIDEPARAAPPKSVWWMLVLPLNFVEDFVIIENVSSSLERQWQARPALAHLGTGRRAGLAWCALQIVSLLPNTAGMVAGLLAVPPWLWHWYFVRVARRRLVEPG